MAGRRPDARYATSSCRSRASRAEEDDGYVLTDEDREWCRRAAKEACDALGLPSAEEAAALRDAAGRVASARQREARLFDRHDDDLTP